MTVQTTPETAANPDDDLTADDYYGPDLPDDPAPPPGPDAPEAAGDGPDEDAPYGWTTDRKTGERRPKKAPGRPRTPPPPEELAAGPDLERPADRPPDDSKRRRRKRPAADLGPVPPMPPSGTLARRINRIYRKAGKLVRALDPMLGEAFIESASTEAPPDPVPDNWEPDLTVGDAWENLCRANPRVRRRVLKLIEGGAVGELVLAHAPIGVAIVSRPAVMRWIPFHRIAASYFEPDEDTQPDDLTPEDVAEMAAVNEQAAERIASRIDINRVPPDVLAAAEKMAAGMGNGTPVPPAFRRQQPRNKTRAKRRG